MYIYMYTYISICGQVSEYAGKYAGQMSLY